MSKEHPPKEIRSKSFATIVYQESASADWKEKLASLFVPAFISPLHDQDKLEDGSPKKAHWHVQLLYPSQKSTAQAKADIAVFGGVGCEKIKNTTGYARYLLHLDNPEKAQYSASDITEICGAKYEKYLLAQTDRVTAMKEMIQFTRENGLICFSDLVDYAEQNRLDWFKILADSRSFLVDYMKSFAWRVKNG